MAKGRGDEEGAGSKAIILLPKAHHDKCVYVFGNKPFWVCFI